VVDQPGDTNDLSGRPATDVSRRQRAETGQRTREPGRCILVQIKSESLVLTPERCLFIPGDFVFRFRRVIVPGLNVE
jgi:hypothetical protein